MIRIEIYRKRHFVGCLVPYYIVINNDIDNLKSIEHLNPEDIIPIKNGETIKIESEKKELTIFAMNGNLEDTKIYPLAITDQIKVNENKKLILKTTKSFKNIELSLEEI